MSSQSADPYTLADFRQRTSCALCEKPLGGTVGVCHSCIESAVFDTTEAAEGICPTCGADADGPFDAAYYRCGCGNQFPITATMKTDNETIIVTAKTLPLLVTQ